MSSLTTKLKNLKDYRSTVDPKVKVEIVLEYAPLVKYIAQKIASRLPSNIELDDLMSCGVIGLMDAIEKFDPTRDNKFKTYAEFRIRGAILDEQLAAMRAAWSRLLPPIRERSKPACAMSTSPT